MHAFAASAGLILALAFAGCEPAAPPAPPAPAPPPSSGSAATPAPPANTPGQAVAASPWLDDGRPQTGLPRLKLFLGASQLNAEVAMTTAAIQKGMMWRTNVAENEGMLFVFGRPHQTSFWMKNVPIDIDVAYLDADGVIREIHRLERHNTNPVASRTANILYALETAEGWFARQGIRPGVAVLTEHGALRDTFVPRTRTP